VTLGLVKHRLPPIWDGWRVKWDAFEDVTDIHICPPPRSRERCECGSVTPRRIARGWRQPKPGEMFESTRRKMGRRGKWVHIPAMVPAWPVVDLHAFRCGDCGDTEVWDTRTDEWWTLGPEDYGPDGSVRPVEREWTGGLFDLIPEPDPATRP
jgi:hypothetical protein